LGIEQYSSAMLRIAGFVLGLAICSGASNIWVVDVSSETLGTQVSVQTCSGLFNRDETVAGASFVLGLNGDDPKWLTSLEPNATKKALSVADYLTKCLTSGIAKGYIRYANWNQTSARQTLPQVVTLAGVLDGVVLDDSVHSPQGAALLRDIQTEWHGWSELKATQYMYENYVNQTSGMSKTNPGWDTSGVKPFMSPKIIANPAINLFDYIVKRRLFNYFLLLGCVPLMEEHRLTEKIAKNNPWEKPVAVYGYDNTMVIAGGTFTKLKPCAPQFTIGVRWQAMAHLTWLSTRARLL